QQPRPLQGCCPPPAEETELIWLPDHQKMSSIAFWCTSTQLLLISSKAGNFLNKVRISLSLSNYQILLLFLLGLASPMSLAFLNKHHKSRFVLQHRFSCRLAAHTP
ncbi:hypothetical protein N322_01314, partial [Cariama cristata]